MECKLWNDYFKLLSWIVNAFLNMTVSRNHKREDTNQLAKINKSEWLFPAKKLSKDKFKNVLEYLQVIPPTHSLFNIKSYKFI